MAHTTLPNDDWTELADGSSAFRVQNIGGAAIWIVYAASAPASTVLEDGFKIEPGTIDDREAFLSTNTLKAYARPSGRDVGSVYVEAIA